MNSISIVGHLGADPELRQTPNSQVCELRVATNDGPDITNWHTVKVWGKGATWPAENLKKGDLVSLVGQLTYRQWEDSDGNKRIRAEIKAFRIDGHRKRGGESAADNKPPF